MPSATTNDPNAGGTRKGLGRGGPARHEAGEVFEGAPKRLGDEVGVSRGTEAVRRGLTG